MSSLRRILSSRANGARSRGPQTAAGKAASSQNNLRHGLLANCVVLRNESPAAFEALLNEHLTRLAPTDGVELGLVEDLVAASWRLRRAWAIETRLMDDALESQDAPDHDGRLAAGFSALAATPALHLLHRYETRLHLMCQRSLQDLLLLRACEARRPDTEAISGTLSCGTNPIPIPDSSPDDPESEPLLPGPA